MSTNDEVKYIKIFGFHIFSDDLRKIQLEHPTKLLITMSPNSYGIATRNGDFQEALKKSEFVVLDGVYFALSSLLLKGVNIKRNQGPDVFSHFMNRLNDNNGKVFFLGSSDATLAEMSIRAKTKYPNLTIKTLSPPYKEKFTKLENQKIIRVINAYFPDILFIGMTAPKQEIWAYQHKDQIDTKLIICIGGVFDWFAGNQKEIHPLWWKLRLAWLKRTIDRPEILVRYPNIGIFFWHLLLASLGNRKIRYGKL